MIEMLEKTTLPIKELILLASKRSAGENLCPSKEPLLVIQELTTTSLWSRFGFI